MAPWTQKQFPNHSRDGKAEFDLTFSNENSGYVHKNEQERGNKRGDNEKRRVFLRGICKKLQLKLPWAFRQQCSLGGKQFSRLLATKSYYKSTSKVIIRQISCIFFLPCPAVIGLKQGKVTMWDLQTGWQVFPQRTAVPIVNILSQVSHLDFFPRGPAFI